MGGRVRTFYVLDADNFDVSDFGEVHTQYPAMSPEEAALLWAEDWADEENDVTFNALYTKRLLVANNPLGEDARELYVTINTTPTVEILDPKDWPRKGGKKK
jgi:hypothetical protein